MEISDFSISLTIIFACLLLSGFFSITETALTSISALKAKHMVENGGRRAQTLKLWLSHPNRVLASVLIGNNLLNIFSSIWAERTVRGIFGESSLFIVTGVMTALIVLFSEIIPKTYAKTHATEIAAKTLYIYRFFYWILFPFTYVMTTLSHWITSLMTFRHHKGPQITEEELEFLINIGEEEGVIAEQKHDMLSGIFELGETVVREIMVHRIDMTAIPHSIPILETLEFFKEKGLSRIPVYEDRIDNIVGIVHVKDVLFYFLRKFKEKNQNFNITVGDIKRDAMFVPETKPVDQLFQDMRRTRQHMAIVLDEYGGTSGIVSMEDIFEEIVGEVRDEFDNEEDAIKPTQVSQQYLVECKIHIDDFCEFFEIPLVEIKNGDNAHEFDTLAGYVLHHLGHIPKVGDKIQIGQVSLEMVEVSKRRVRRVLVTGPQEKKLSEKPIGKQDKQSGKN